MGPNASLDKVNSETVLVSCHPWFLGDSECGKSFSCILCACLLFWQLSLPQPPNSGQSHLVIIPMILSVWLCLWCWLLSWLLWIPPSLYKNYFPAPPTLYGISSYSTLIYCWWVELCTTSLSSISLLSWLPLLSLSLTMLSSSLLFPSHQPSTCYM